MVIVDGTGTDTYFSPDDGQYEINYGNSACRRLSRMYPGAVYQRGPWLDGSNMRPIIDEAYNRAMAFAGMFGRGCSGLCLFGHSRGGAAVIAVAQRLKEQGIPVGFMGLFDAVEMDLNFGWDVDCIPGNVQSVYHVERNPAALSRPWWGNCGDAWENGRINRLIVWGTHGCIGGVPPGRPPDTSNPDPESYIREAANLIPTRVKVKEGWKAADDAWDYIVRLGLANALQRMEANPEPPVAYPGDPPADRPGNGGGGQPTPGGPRYGPGGKTHIVRKGESLSLIAGKYYGDVLLWPVIYDANRPPCGSNPNLIEPNWRLKIASIAGKGKQELDAIRERGRHC
jgi:hypothetical protein